MWPKAGPQTWSMLQLVPPACRPCFLLPRTLQRSPTVLSEVPFPTALFPSWDGGSIEACDKCLHTDPSQLSAFAVGTRLLPTCQPRPPSL